MKKEIKFRALKDDMSNCNFCYGQLTYGINSEPRIHNNVGLYTTCLKGTESQFTGLQDENGKDIYKDDILEVIDTKSVLLVLWDKDCYLVRKIYDSWTESNVLHKKQDCSLNFMTGFKIKIIGNTHQNSQLLKQGK